jgi:hypothetical protein
MAATATAPPATEPEGAPVSWAVEQVPDGWQVHRDGAPLGGPHPSYAEAVGAIRDDLAAAEAPTADGLLAEQWHSPAGIAFAEPTGDGRDFTDVAWSWRDPDTSLLPLMFQDQTDMGHFGARLAGTITQLTEQGGTVHATGRFYDSDQGRAARDLLLGGRRFGVSVDPGAVDATWECVAEDADGWCTEELVRFGAYEVIGLTMTPFPAFANAAIELAGAEGQLAVAAADHAFTDANGDGNCDACLAEDADGNCTEVCDLPEAEHTAAPEPEAEASAVVADASGRLHARLRIAATPPRWWFELPEPHPGDPHLVEQPDGALACPLTIADDGQVFGHVARWGQCHVGYPGACVTAPASVGGYRDYHLGQVRTDDGALAVGCLTIGCDHAPDYLQASGARDHYAHTGMAWADVRLSDGDLGVWACGALRPDVRPELVRVLRASTLSGDWRGGELVAVLAVNTPGFPIVREALAASGVRHLADVRPAARLHHGATVTLTAAGQVRRCPDCAARAAAARGQLANALSPADLAHLSRMVAGAVEAAVEPLAAQLGLVEQRTRHLRAAEAEHLRQRVRR